MDLLQTIGVGNKVWRAGLHTVLKREVNEGTDSSANDRLIIISISLDLEAASLQWMESEKELKWRSPSNSNQVAFLRD